MKTNFEAWYNHYGRGLLHYYYRFCVLFEEGQEPTFMQFMVHCFRNTKQHYNRLTNTYTAPIF